MLFQPVFFETLADAQQAADRLAALSGSARRLLAEAVEHQELVRTRLCVAAQSLEEVGFLRVLDRSDLSGPRMLLYPTLAGEEALECLETGLHCKPPVQC
jgi:hypothetical protein